MEFHCPLCQGSMSPWISMPIDPKKETPCTHGAIHRCEKCSYGSILPRPREEEIEDFYDLKTYYTQGASHFTDGGPASLMDRLRESIAWSRDFSQELRKTSIPELFGDRSVDICDVGCGSEGMAIQAAALGHRVIGVEIDPKTAEQGRANGLEIYLGSAEDLPEEVSSRTFDYVVMTHVLEHCLDPVRAFENVCRLVRPGGYLLCEVPNNASAGLAGAGAAWEALDVPRHLNFFVAANLVKLCEMAGLKLEKVYYTHYCRQFLNDWINTEGRIWDAIRSSGLPAHPSPVRNSKMRAWKLLAKTAFARDEVKYDSVGILARRP